MINERRAIELIDKMCSEQRKLSITVSHGQDEVYKEKYDQACDFISGGSLFNTAVAEDLYPLLAAHADAFGVSIQEAADVIIEKRQQWIRLVSSIERIRLKAKHEIRNTSNDKQIHHIIDRVKGELLNNKKNT